jgi:predicted dehydrogenase
MPRRVGIIMNGVTGRMGTHQHLVRSVASIRDQGGVPLAGGETLVPDPILVGRNEKKLRSLAETHGVRRWSTDLEECLADPRDEVYFDSQTTRRRAEAVRMAIAAGKHVYCEKPTAANLTEALELAREKGVKNGVVQDKPASARSSRDHTSPTSTSKTQRSTGQRAGAPRDHAGHHLRMGSWTSSSCSRLCGQPATTDGS